jgi:hypothetical protein
MLQWRGAAAWVTVCFKSMLLLHGSLQCRLLVVMLRA